MLMQIFPNRYPLSPVTLSLIVTMPFDDFFDNGINFQIAVGFGESGDIHRQANGMTLSLFPS
jgi:hypothetical protein